MNVAFCDISINSLENKDAIKNGINHMLERSDYISGKENPIFEDAFASYVGRRYCVGVGNGTDAIEIAIESLQMEQGSTILVQGNSYIATALAVKNQRIPYELELVDVNKDTNMIDMDDLEKKSTHAKLLIITHLFGFMPNMDDIIHFCKRHNIYLIEDCAQAHGATWNHQKAGSFGVLSCFSFYPTKNLGAFGDGGAIVTNNTSLYHWVKRRATMGSVTKNKFEIIGRNSRLDTLQAFVLHEKLPYLDKNNEKRRQIATLYTILLQNIPEVKIISYDEKCNPVYHLYVIRVKDRDRLQHFLKEQGITSLVHYPTCIGKTDAFLESRIVSHTPHCEELSNEILSLPMYPTLLHDIPKILYVTQKIKEFYGYDNSLRNHPKVVPFVTKEVEDKPGKLHAINHIDRFLIKRVFYLDGFEHTSVPAQRGNHCNQNTNEYLSVLHGTILLEVEDQTGNVENILLEKNDSFYIAKNTWIRYTILDKSTSIVVLCDTTFDEQIVLSDYSVFKEMSRSSLNS